MAYIRQVLFVSVNGWSVSDAFFIPSPLLDAWNDLCVMLLLVLGDSAVKASTSCPCGYVKHILATNFLGACLCRSSASLTASKPPAGTVRCAAFIPYKRLSEGRRLFVVVMNSRMVSYFRDCDLMWPIAHERPRSQRFARCFAAPQMFLTQDALFVLVVDTSAYSEDGSSKEDALEQWLDILQSRVPGSVVVLIGKHGDLFASSAERRKRVECVKKGWLCCWRANLYPVPFQYNIGPPSWYLCVCRLLAQLVVRICLTLSRLDWLFLSEPEQHPRMRCYNTCTSFLACVQ